MYERVSIPTVAVPSPPAKVLQAVTPPALRTMRSRVRHPKTPQRSRCRNPSAPKTLPLRRVRQRVRLAKQPGQPPPQRPQRGATLRLPAVRNQLQGQQQSLPASKALPHHAPEGTAQGEPRAARATTPPARLRPVRQNVRHQVHAGQPPAEHPHRRAVLPVPALRDELQGELGALAPPEALSAATGGSGGGNGTAGSDSRGQEAVCVRAVREDVPDGAGAAEARSEPPLGGEEAEEGEESAGEGEEAEEKEGGGCFRGCQGGNGTRGEGGNGGRKLNWFE
uniref:(northern house mosquito) hypothetical protein n=1 Tax=Culex pipiens TaxID=7175 RepID=A0A8D8A2E3_CULPI